MSFPHLVPASEFHSGFTTCHSIYHEHIEQVALEDKTLGVHKVSSATSHELVEPPTPSVSNPEVPPPTHAWEAFYPKGSINPTAPIPGGFGFYLSGPPAFAQSLRDGATEVVLSYRMMLEEGWEWVKGGKLPGVFGGVGDLSYGCTGGRKEQRCKCFDMRPMWRPKAVAELYTYLPLTERNKERLLGVPPTSRANSDYGFSVGRGAFKLDVAIGKWISVAFRIKLNDVGSENGEVEMWIDGESVISLDGISLRESEDGRIKGMHFQTFFGGHSDEWASPKDQRAWFADVTGVVIR